MYAKLSVCLVAFVLASCAIAPNTIEGTKISKINTVRVGSLIGDKLERVHVGTFVFGNRRAEYSIADWRVDDEAEAILIETLKRAGIQTVDRITHGRAELATALEVDRYETPDFERIGSILRTGEPYRDAYILLVRARDNDRVTYSNQLLEGTGLYSRVSGGVRDSGAIILAPFVWYNILVIDGSTQKPIGWKGATMKRYAPVLMDREDIRPFKRIDQVHYKEDFLQSTEADKQAVRQAMIELLSRSVPYTLRELGFAVKCCE